MAQGQKIGEGYLDIEADVDGALADMRKFFKAVDGELAAGEKAFQGYGEKSGKNYADGLNTAKVDETLRRVTARALDAAEGESRRRGGLLGALMGRGGRRFSLRTLLPDRGLFSRMFAGLKSGGKSLMSGLGSLFSGGAKLFSGITEGISKAFSSGLDQAQQAWKSASGFFQQLSNIGGGVGGAIQVGAMGLAVPIAFGLAGAIAHLSAALLALPAAVSVAIAAIAPLIVAFKGFGEAVSAGMSGDVDAFNEALKKLTPNARAVAKEFVKLGPALSNIKAQTQNAFFGPLIGQLAPLAKGLLPALANGMAMVAAAWGRFAAGFVQMLNAPDIIEDIGDVFETTARIIDRFGPTMTNLFAVLFGIIEKGLPWVERFAGVVAGGLDRFAEWLSKIQQPGGAMEGWLARAWNVGKQLWEVFKNLGMIVGTMLNAFGDEGTDTLTGIAEKLREINKYLQSDEGAETLHNLGVIVHWAGNALVFFVGTLVSAWRGLNAVFDFVRGIGPFFANLWAKIVSGVKAVGNWFVWLGSTIWGGITDAWHAVVGFGQSVWDALVRAYNAVIGFGKSVVDWFVALPARIGAFFAALPGIIGGAMTMVADNLLYLIGYLGGLIANFFTSTLPNLFISGWNFAVQATLSSVNAIASFVAGLFPAIWHAMVDVGNIIKNTFLGAWAWATQATINGINTAWAWISGLPGRAGSALSRLMDSIGGWFSRAWESAKTATYNGYRAIVAFINSIGPAIKSAFSNAGSWLYNAGRDVIRGLADGIADMLSWAVDKARNAANRIKQGFLDAFDIGSPSRVMRVEVGRWLLPGVMQGIQDTQPRMDKYLGTTADRIRGGFNPTVNVAAPNVSVGGTTLIADLGDGIRQAVPVQIMRNTGVVAAAANVGNRRRAAWSNTGRTVITGTG